MTSQEQEMVGMHLEPEARAAINKAECPICESIEGCDHTVRERLRAYEDVAFRDQMRADDPLYQLQQRRAKARTSLSKGGE